MRSPLAQAIEIASAFSAARREAGRWLSPGECLVMMAAHFIEVWKPVLAQRNTLQRKTHHLHGVHIGAIRVSGKAPDQLRWEVRVGPRWEALVEAC